MAVAQWTQVAEDDLAEIAYWTAVKESRPQMARLLVEEVREKANWLDAQATRLAPAVYASPTIPRAVNPRTRCPYLPESVRLLI